MGTRYLRPEVTILSISQGDTLTIRKRLTHGERNASYARMYQVGADGDLHVNRLLYGIALVTAYLIDWTLVGMDDKLIVIRDEPMEVVEAALNNLPPEDFDEIKSAIEAHEKAMLKARAQEKKRLAGKSEPVTISTSPSDAVGSSTGSVN